MANSQQRLELNLFGLKIDLGNWRLEVCNQSRKLRPDKLWKKKLLKRKLALHGLQMKNLWWWLYRIVFKSIEFMIPKLIMEMLGIFLKINM